MDAKKRVVKYRGISNVIRRGVTNGELKGVISVSDVRRLLPESKATAPGKVIEKSLYHLAKNNEIVGRNGRYHTRDSVPAAPTASMGAGVESMITGKVLSTEVRGGKIIATVEVTSLDNK